MLWKTSAAISFFAFFVCWHEITIISSSLWKIGEKKEVFTHVTWLHEKREKQENLKMTGNWKSSGNFRSTFFVFFFIYHHHPIWVNKKEKRGTDLFWEKCWRQNSHIIYFNAHMYYTICTVTTRMARAKLWMFGKLLKLTLNEKIATILPKGKKSFSILQSFIFL